MNFQIPTPVIGLIIFVACLVSVVALTIAGSPVPIEVKYAMGISLGALFGGTVPSLNVGKES